MLTIYYEPPETTGDPVIDAMESINLYQVLLEKIAEQARILKWQCSEGEIDRKTFDIEIDALHQATEHYLHEFNLAVGKVIELPPQEVGIELHQRLIDYANQLRRKLN